MYCVSPQRRTSLGFCEIVFFMLQTTRSCTKLREHVFIAFKSILDRRSCRWCVCLFCHTDDFVRKYFICNPKPVNSVIHSINSQMSHRKTSLLNYSQHHSRFRSVNRLRKRSVDCRERKIVFVCLAGLVVRGALYSTEATVYLLQHVAAFVCNLRSSGVWMC